ncbi:MAG: hypothetical protein SFV54_01285 [Bryobacteraceae bacterium]|nr:hypothetical protein [Bryobacteraceae bacterium]
MRRVLGLALLLCGSMMAGELKLPDTPVGKRFSKFVEVFNTGDHKAFVAFHKETTSEAEAVNRADQDVNASKQTGGLKLHSVTQSNGNYISVLAQTKNGGEWIQFEFEVAKDAPHDVTNISVRPAEAPKDPAK